MSSSFLPIMPTILFILPMSIPSSVSFAENDMNASDLRSREIIATFAVSTARVFIPSSLT